MLKKIIAFQKMLYVSTPKINDAYEIIMIFLAWLLTNIHISLSIIVFISGFAYILYQKMYQKKTQVLLLPVTKRFYINNLFIYGIVSFIEIFSIFFLILFVFALCVLILTICMNSWQVLFDVVYEIPMISFEAITMCLLLFTLYMCSVTTMITMKKGKNVIALCMIFCIISFLIYLFMKENLMIQFMILFTAIASIGICPWFACRFARPY